MVRVLFFENLMLAFSSLRTNKMRAFLTMLGIIIGIGSVIAIVTVGNSLTNSITESMASMGANNIMVGLQQRSNDEEKTESGMVFRGPNYQKQPTKEDYFTDEMIEGFVAKYPNEVKDISISQDIGSGKVTVGNDYANVQITGVNSGYLDSQDLTLLQGNFFSDKAYEDGKGVCLVSDYFVDNMYKGDKEAAIGQSIDIDITSSGYKYYTYTIIGVYEYEASMFMTQAKKDVSTTMYVPLKSAQSKSHVFGYQMFTVITNTDVESDSFKYKISDYFDRYYRKNDDFQVNTFSYASIVSTFTDMLGTVQTAISVIAAISLLVGGIGVMNIMLVSISERTKEIGTRKALGATNGSIRIQFIMEAIVICVIGGIIGIIVGIVGGSIGAKALGYAASPSIESIIVSLLFSMAIGVFFGYYPANKAAKMNPIDALRYE